MTLQNPTADFNQQGWDIAKAIDGDPKSAWGIYPEVGRDHQAVFEIKDPVGFAGGAALTFILDQNHGGGHLIGRPRLSVTTAAPPVSINFWPDNVAKILATPQRQRRDEQKIELGLYYLKSQAEQRLAALPPPQKVYAGASDFAPDGSFKPALTPREIHLLKRGDINNPGDPALPAPAAPRWPSGSPIRRTR